MTLISAIFFGKSLARSRPGQRSQANRQRIWYRMRCACADVPDDVVKCKAYRHLCTTECILHIPGKRSRQSTCIILVFKIVVSNFSSGWTLKHLQQSTECFVAIGTNVVLVPMSYSLTRAPLGYFYNAPHWGGGLFRAPPLLSPKLLDRF